MARRDYSAAVRMLTRRAPRDRPRSPATLPGVALSELTPGLLVAMPQLLDPNFRRAVVLLVHHDGDGTFGIVLNRGSGVMASHLCESLDIEWRGDPAREVGLGGPVQPNTGWVLFDSGHGIVAEQEVKEIADGLSFAGSLEVLRYIAKVPPETVRLFLGYAGWGPGQLEAELAQGAWLLAPVSSSTVFAVEPERMWEHVVRSLGVDPATLVPSRGVH